MAIHIRNLEESDHTEVMDLIERTIRHNWTEMNGEELTEALIRGYKGERFLERLKTIEYWVAVDSDSQKVVGIIGLSDGKNKIGAKEVRSFFVDPTQQGQGIGRTLYDRLEQVARERGIHDLEVAANRQVVGMYEHFGYHQVGVVHQKAGEIEYDDFELEKRL